MQSWMASIAIGTSDRNLGSNSDVDSCKYLETQGVEDGARSDGVFLEIHLIAPPDL